MRRNRNAVVRAFEQAFVAQLKAAGIEPCGVVSYHEETPRFAIDTRGGRYTFYCEPQIGPQPLNFISVFGQFDEPSRARQYVDCNHHSGKWNFDDILHVASVEEAQKHATDIVTKILNV